MWVNLTEYELLVVKQALNAATMGAGLPSPSHAQPVLDRIEELEKEDPDDQAFRDAHRERYSSHPWTDGDIDIDDDAMVSRGDEGAYVMMWGYVRNEDAGIFAFQTWEEAAKSQGWEITTGDAGEEPILYNDKLDRIWPFEDGKPDWEGAASDAGIEDFEVKEANE